jgi:hypothetical protein
MTALPLQFGLLEGEIIAYQEQDSTVSYHTYIVKVYMPDGTEAIVRNAIASTGLYGGQWDYCQYQYRATADTGEQAKYDVGPDADQTIGDRVLVGFISGDIRRPIIVCAMPHPMSVSDVASPNEMQPQLTFQLQGMKFEISPEGNFTMLHQGKPTVTPGGSSPGFKDDVLTQININEEGDLTIIDSQKQMVKISTSDKKITITNSKDKIVLDASSNTIDIESKGELNIKSAKDCNITVGGDANIDVDKNCNVKATTVAAEGSGGKMKLTGGKVAIGSDTAEVCELLETFWKEMLNSAPHIGDSFVSPVVLSPALVTVLTELSVKIGMIKGSL